MKHSKTTKFERLYSLLYIISFVILFLLTSSGNPKIIIFVRLITPFVWILLILIQFKMVIKNNHLKLKVGNLFVFLLLAALLFFSISPFLKTIKSI